MTFKIPTKVQVYGKDIQKEDLKYHSHRVLLSKEFTFDSAHHLHEYEGKCKNLHGHTYKVIFGISSYTDETGIGIDFGDIKKIWKEQIEVHLDHKYLNESLPKMNTTAENISVWIYEKMKQALIDYDHLQPRIEFIRLYETPTSFAEVRREWMEDTNE